ncbi:hypothetical protein DsansV1_C15g0132051 [Dioscorea sansibarensis]
MVWKMCYFLPIQLRKSVMPILLMNFLYLPISINISPTSAGRTTRVTGSQIMLLLVQVVEHKKAPQVSWVQTFQTVVASSLSSQLLSSFPGKFLSRTILLQWHDDTTWGLNCCNLRVRLDNPR